MGGRLIGEYGQTARDIWAEIRQLHESLLRCDFGIGYLDDALLGLFPGETTLVGARTGGGKTEFATQVLLHQQSDTRAKSVLYFALDHEPGEIENRLLWRLIISRVRQDSPDDPIGRSLRYADWRAGHYVGILDAYEREYRLKIDHLLSLSETRFIYKKGELGADEIAKLVTTSYQEFNLIIVDHFHAIKFPGDKWDGQAKAMLTLSRAAQVAGRPLLILGQFKKRGPQNRFPIPDLEEFSGPMDLMYIPNNVVVFAPNSKGATGETYFHIAKARVASDAKGYVGAHGFDLTTKNYSPKYTMLKFQPYSEPLELMPSEIPSWARKARRPSMFERR